MTIWDRVDEIINKIENRILLHLNEEEREEVLGMVEELAHNWQQTNAHARALTVCAAVLAGEKLNPEEVTAEELSFFEGQGTQALIHAVGMPVYVALIEHFTPRTDAAEDEENGEGDGE